MGSIYRESSGDPVLVADTFTGLDLPERARMADPLSQHNL
jgi:hypothetical protein